MGSSPLARGLRRAGDRLELHLGIIPARAGFTSPTPSVSSRSRDHPRSRGVYAHACMGIHSMIGSSPLARGLHHRRRRRRRQPRIIPARAGFTPSRRPPPPGTRDHPRSRGVYTPSATSSSPSLGSSPLARGLPPPPWATAAGRGIIPARAGFTQCWRRRRAPRQGSSPLARGLPGGVGGVLEGFGIIPARAGFTERVLGFDEQGGDHPRSRGVYRPCLSWTV